MKDSLQKHQGDKSSKTDALKYCFIAEEMITK